MNLISMNGKEFCDKSYKLLTRYDDQMQQLDPIPKQFVYSPEEIKAINSDKYFGEYQNNNFNSGFMPNVQRGVGYYGYAY